MKIAVIGAGYVGLVTAVGLAELGHTIIGTDKDSEKIEKTSRGTAPIYEPGLDELLKRNLEKGTLTFTADVGKAVRDAEVIFVCVGTPQDENGRPDMSQIEQVSRSIAQNLNGYKIIVEKSTVPVKTSDWIKRIITLYRKGDAPFDVASNPEFLREGTAVADFLEPDRIIVGVESDRARDILVRIYEKFRDKIIVTNIDTAELIKHASNSFLALKISFINMISDLCEKTDADIEQVALGMGRDPRIGKDFLRAGLGYGGSCFPKDIKALTKLGEDMGVNMNLLKEADRINHERAEAFLAKIRKVFVTLKDKKIALLGLAFKPETDDIREASSIKIIRELAKEGAVLRLCDPKAMDKMKHVFPESPQVVYCTDPFQAAQDANALLVITEWPEFRTLDLARIKKLMADPIIIDGRNMFKPGSVRKLGFTYDSVGRK